MPHHQIRIYLDAKRAGHAYLEMLDDQGKCGDVYGYYPAKYDEKREVLFGEGKLRHDRERLDEMKRDPAVQQTRKIVALTGTQYRRAERFLREQWEKPNYYFLVGYNCVDFIQDTIDAAFGDEEGPQFLDDFTVEELEELSWVGVYARLRK